VLAADVADTVLIGKRHGLPVRGLRNQFAEKIFEAEDQHLSDDAYDALFKSSTLKQAALEGNVDWGKVEAGQSAGLVHQIQPAAQVMHDLVHELDMATRRIHHMCSNPY